MPIIAPFRCSCYTFFMFILIGGFTDGNAELLIS
ncbi:hypothetical protein SAMN05216191_103302 [Paenibacillus jilunlii]|uniref:Uncharacterized protein n=1 Tax=Paenibacillus jilunlii TaxID=682956 RepID=A0A1G9KLG7_9BACL|nr:hypothetical protein SAMN05216191_103302 [Paenibacillus jilunlii]